MSNKWSSKAELKWSLVTAFICIILLLFIGRRNREELRLIDQQGIVVEGTVIHRGKAKMGRGHTTRIEYRITYEYEYQGRRHRDALATNSSLFYEMAIVGMKYQVKVIEGNKKYKSHIYIECPIELAYLSIPDERERILKECGPGFEQIPTARDYYQIAHLIPEEYYNIIVQNEQNEIIKILENKAK